ncbi:MAG: hypothetical protein ABR585_10385 [Gemmatimonadaceae bacterium]
MTCQECLSALAVASLRELDPDSPEMAHCAACPDCSRVTTRLREREYAAATLLNNLPPLENPITVAEHAAVTAQRRRLGGVAVMITGTALAVTVWIVAATTVIPALNRGDARRASDLRTETIPLSCLSPQQAGDIINPYIRSHGSTYYVPSTGISAITVRARPAELVKAHVLIGEFEESATAACRVPPAGSPVLADEKQKAAVEKPGGKLIRAKPVPNP